MAVLPLVAGILMVLGGCGGESSRESPGGAQGGSDGGAQGGSTDGAQLFVQSGCGSCHTLAAAGTSGTVGPNLDRRMPTVEEAARAIANGQPGMPAYAGRLSEAEIQALARFVSQSTRR